MTTARDPSSGRPKPARRVVLSANTMAPRLGLIGVPRRSRVVSQNACRFEGNEAPPTPGSCHPLDDAG